MRIPEHPLVAQQVYTIYTCTHVMCTCTCVYMYVQEPMRAKAQGNIQLRIVHVAIDHVFGHVARAGTNMASHKFQTLIVV